MVVKKKQTALRRLGTPEGCQTKLVGRNFTNYISTNKSSSLLRQTGNNSNNNKRQKVEMRRNSCGKSTGGFFRKTNPAMLIFL
jgi:hypothetical protein